MTTPARWLTPYTERPNLLRPCKISLIRSYHNSHTASRLSHTLKFSFSFPDFLGISFSLLHFLFSFLFYRKSFPNPILPNFLLSALTLLSGFGRKRYLGCLFTPLFLFLYSRKYRRNQHLGVSIDQWRFHRRLPPARRHFTLATSTLTSSMVSSSMHSPSSKASLRSGFVGILPRAGHFVMAMSTSSLPKMVFDLFYNEFSFCFIVFIVCCIFLFGLLENEEESRKNK